MNLTVFAGILLAVTTVTARRASLGEKTMQAAAKADEPDEAMREAARPASLVEKIMRAADGPSTELADRPRCCGPRKSVFLGIIMKTLKTVYEKTKDNEKWAGVWDQLRDMLSKEGEKAAKVETAKKVAAGETEEEAMAEVEAEVAAEVQEAEKAVKVVEKNLKKEVKKKVAEGETEEDAEAEVVEGVKTALAEEAQEEMEEEAEEKAEAADIEAEEKVAEGETAEQAVAEVEEEAAEEEEEEEEVNAKIQALASAAPLAENRS